jgi:proteasome-associated ATPase
VVAVPESEFDRKIAQYDRDVQELQGQVKLLEEELALTRRKLESAPKRIHELERRLSETAADLAAARENNDKLAGTLRDAREQLAALKEQVEKLSQPPASYGVYLQPYEDDNTADVFTNGRKLRVNISPEIEMKEMKRGQEVVLNEAMNVIGISNFDIQGEVVTLKEVLEGGQRALVIGRTDEERVVELADPVMDMRLRAGDSLLL